MVRGKENAMCAEHTKNAFHGQFGNHEKDNTLDLLQMHLKENIENHTFPVSQNALTIFN